MRTVYSASGVPLPNRLDGDAHLLRAALGLLTGIALLALGEVLRRVDDALVDLGGE